MKIQYLGTAAAEAIPAVFCHCEVCEQARKLKGKNLRARTQALINDDMLVDLCPDTYMNSVRFGVDLSKIKHVLITHTHSDHFLPYELEFRTSAKNLAADSITVYGTKAVGDAMKKMIKEYDCVHFKEIELFKPTVIGEYTVTALEAIHMQTETAVIYIIEYKGKSLLYCNDTGMIEGKRTLTEADMAYLKTLKKPLDFIGFDCTYATVPLDTYHGHLSLADDACLWQKFKEIGAATDKTIVYATHFSHWNMLMHDEMQKLGDKYNIKIAYDGVTVEF